MSQEHGVADMSPFKSQISYAGQVSMVKAWTQAVCRRSCYSGHKSVTCEILSFFSRANDIPQAM